MPDIAASRWQPLSPWTDALLGGRFGRTEGQAGVRIEPLARTPLALIIARAGRSIDISKVTHGRLGCDLPSTGRFTGGPDGRLVWSAPEQWLAIGAVALSVLEPSAPLAGLAAVSDQTDSRALVEISGPDARQALAKGFAIDLHPSAFAPGQTAITNVAHISVQIWQTDAAPRYTIAVPRSFVASFGSWLTTAAAAYGYEVEQTAA